MELAKKDVREATREEIQMNQLLIKNSVVYRNTSRQVRFECLPVCKNQSPYERRIPSFDVQNRCDPVCTSCEIKSRASTVSGLHDIDLNKEEIFPR